jgi:tetratricopeptide (TPR) repeat protein
LSLGGGEAAHRHRLVPIGIVGLALLIFASGGAYAAPEAGSQAVVDADSIEEVLASAREDAAAGRCEAATDRLSAIDGLGSRALLLGGRCRVEQGLYEEALDDFSLAREIGDLPPDLLAELDLYRGVALYHLERFDEAEAALDEADGSSTVDPAQLALYEGLVALRRNDNERAAPSLESAARMDPGQTEPIASYYAGLAWLGATERSKARDAFQRVIDRDPDGPWGRQAAKQLEAMEPVPFFVRLSAGFEYDDNVLLRALGTDQLPSDGGGKDWRGVWTAEAGVQLFATDDWAGGLLGSYYGSKHHDLDDFDTHYPTVSAYVDHRLGTESLGRLRYGFGYAWVDQGSFLRTQFVEGSFLHIWEQAGTTQVVADVTWNDFRFRNEGVADVVPIPPPPTCPGPDACSPFGVNETRARDRDGYGLAATFEHRYPLSIPDEIDEMVESVELRGSYRFERYDSQGTEWEYFSNIFSLGFMAEFPWDVSLDAEADYERYDFDNPSTYPDSQTPGQPYTLSGSDRKENAVYVKTELDKDLNEYFSVSARYTYYEVDSNRRVYSYRRHIGGMYVNFRFD